MEATTPVERAPFRLEKESKTAFQNKMRLA